jgi:hypothetical protein
MSEFVINQEKVAGVVLIISFLSIIVGLIIIGTQGKLVGLTSAFRGVEGIGEQASAHSIIAKSGLLSTLLQIVGFGILASMLYQSGEAPISTVAYGLLLFSSAVLAVGETFHGSVTVWAGQYWEHTGNVPELYEALRKWVNVSMQLVYMLGYLISMAAFGWGVLRAGLLPSWVGWVSIGWSVPWIIVSAFFTTLPAVIIILPLIFGIGLLL